MARYIVAVDIGGTFSDLVALDTKTGQIRNVKVPSTPPTFIEGVMEALRKSGVPPVQMIVFKHGSTIATNAIIQRRGANTGLVTTRGFRDVLEAGRADRPDLFALGWDPNPLLVLRRNRLVVTEKVDFEGNVLTPLSEEDVQACARAFRKRGIEAVSVCFINSFMNPAHEQRTKELLEKELPGVFVTCSSEILPEMREFERMSTTTVNAYVGPILDRYLDSLTDAMRGWGYRGDILIIHSGGGVVTCDAARAIPARTCQSGPAGGVIGGALIGTLAGFPNVITFDIGGTSTDLALVYKGQPLTQSGWKVEFKIPIRFPCIDVISIGAGGGSIAWIDPGGTLKNGPHSAGARPGPACYGLGGTEPTNTDANLVLGRLNPATFLGGEMRIDPELARRAIQEKIADPYGMSVEEAADGIISVANANMVNGTRLISVERGYDPREFAIVAFGGGGPLHAVDVARQLNIPKVVVPEYPGIASAFGQLQVEMRHDYLRPILQREKEVDLEKVDRIFTELEEQARRAMASEGVPAGKVALRRAMDVKYFPQSSALTIPVKAGRLEEREIARIVADFLARHEHCPARSPIRS
ncbi:MAG: hydantoinase/oxoprolinase family protein [Deltaproteobacteria bacterium]|nr:hydantoinase/oxoprolinase family protein [Deltaproteobacteria bacterium]